LLTTLRNSHVEHSMRVGIYARVSTRDQSCDLQLRDLRAYCAARPLTIAREYVDAGVSGTKDSRPQLNELMADARKRKLDAILVWRFDRFARSTRHLLLALEEFRTLSVGFISYQENIETTTPLGQALFVIIAAIAELERGLICERVCAGINHARAKGKRLGRPRQYVDAERIVEMQASGKSLHQISTALNVGYGTVRDRLQATERKTLAKVAEDVASFTGVSAVL
jgi:DNA invertase Pin-like site-specific DNA recombinase